MVSCLENRREIAYKLCVSINRENEDYGNGRKEGTSVSGTAFNFRVFSQLWIMDGRMVKVSNSLNFSRESANKGLLEKI